MEDKKRLFGLLGSMLPAVSAPVDRDAGVRGTTAHWRPDEDSTECVNCKTAWSLLTRKHHCRRCGRVFCGACTSMRVSLVNLGFAKPQRVCSYCALSGVSLYGNPELTRPSRTDAEAVQKLLFYIQLCKDVRRRCFEYERDKLVQCGLFAHDAPQKNPGSCWLRV